MRRHQFFSASPLALAGYPLVWTDNTCVIGVLVIKTQKGEVVVARKRHVLWLLQVITSVHVVRCVSDFGGFDNCPCAALHVLVQFVYCRFAIFAVSLSPGCITDLPVAP